MQESIFKYIANGELTLSCISDNSPTNMDNLQNIFEFMSCKIILLFSDKILQNIEIRVSLNAFVVCIVISSADF